MRIRSAPMVVFLFLTVLGSSQELKLPVFFLRYDGGLGSEAIEPEEGEEEEIEPYSQRHRVTLRIKEQWSESLTTNLYSAVSRKEYFDRSGSYTYFFLNPDLAWNISERLQWSSAFRSKWTWYDGGEGDPDLTSLLARTELTIRVLDQLKLIPAVQSVLDLHRSPADNQATCTGGIGIESRLGSGIRLSGRYRGIVRTALGGQSTVTTRINNEFGVNLSWDPNK